MKIVILGGGISGVSAAYFTARSLGKKLVNCELILIDKNPRAGGWMKSKRFGNQDDTNSPIIENGPRSVRTAGMVGKHTLKLVNDIGLADQIIPVSSRHVAAKKRLIYANEKLHVLPNSLTSGCSKFKPTNNRLLPKLAKGYLKSLPREMESMYDVCNHRFGKEITQYLIDPFVRGVFAADIKELSMKAAFPPMWNMLGNKKANQVKRPAVSNEEKLSKSLKKEKLALRSSKEKWTQWSFINGLQTLPLKLEKVCVSEFGVEVIHNANLSNISIENDGHLSVKYSSPENNHSIDNIDHIISALPSYSLCSLLNSTRKIPNCSKESSELYYNLKYLSLMLEEIKFVNVGVVNLEYRGSPQSNLPEEGFGHLVPSCEPSSNLGVIYDSCCFPHHDRKDLETTRLTCMLGGSWFEEKFGPVSPGVNDKLLNAAIESIAQQLNIRTDPLNVQVHLAVNAIPTYRVGHAEAMQETDQFILKNKLPISLVGSSFWGVSINDCIYNSRVVAEKLVNNINASL